MKENTLQVFKIKKTLVVFEIITEIRGFEEIEKSGDSSII
jgi:hypothetical protein